MTDVAVTNSTPGLPAPPSSIRPGSLPPSPSLAFAPFPSALFPPPHAFPVTWLCSTCSAAHSVLTLLSASGGAGWASPCCARPTLQAVYDQHGRIFLYWRNDPAIADLRDPARVREAAGRVAEAAGCGGGVDGGDPVGWLRDALLVLGPEERASGRARAGSRASESSFASEDTVMSV